MSDLNNLVRAESLFQVDADLGSMSSLLTLANRYLKSQSKWISNLEIQNQTLLQMVNFHTFKANNSIDLDLIKKCQHSFYIF